MNVLIADNRRETREVVATHLADAGHQIFAAENGRDALALLHKHHPDLALLDLDLELPHISAFELARITRENSQFQNTRLVACSAGLPAAGWQEAAEAGFDFVLSKPIPRDTIDAVLEAPANSALSRASLDLRTRSAEIQKKSDALSLRAAAAQARAASVREKFGRIVTPNKLNLAVSKHARSNGYARVCFVVVKLEDDKVVHTGKHFSTVAAAKKFARTECNNGYFYSLNERQTAGRAELFPALEQVQHYLDFGSFS